MNSTTSHINHWYSRVTSRTYHSTLLRKNSHWRSSTARRTEASTSAWGMLDPSPTLWAKWGLRLPATRVQLSQQVQCLRQCARATWRGMTSPRCRPRQQYTHRQLPAKFQQPPCFRLKNLRSAEERGKKRTVRAEGDPKYLIWGPHREESAMRDRQGHGLYLEYFPAWGSHVAKIFLETKLLKIIRYVGNVSEYFSRTTFDYGGIF